jgi:predicted amidohydrolase
MKNQQLRLALVQSDLQWEDPVQNQTRIRSQLGSVDQALDLIVLPEMFSTGFTMAPHRIPKASAITSLTWMKELAAEKDAMVIGSLVWPLEDTPESYANRLFAVWPDGRSSQYDKRHCFTLAGEDKVYTAGEDRLLIEWRGFRICPLICYDLRFPVWSRNTEDYDILLYVANWPAPRINAWDALLTARAIENMAFCAGVNRVGLDAEGHQYPGHTALYDPLGKQLAFSKEVEEVLLVDIQKEEILKSRSKLKFLEDRDAFELL